MVVSVTGKSVKVAVLVGAAPGKDTSKTAPTIIKFTALAASRTVPIIRPGVMRQQIFLDLRIEPTPQALATPGEGRTCKPVVWRDRSPSQPGHVAA